LNPESGHVVWFYALDLLALIALASAAWRYNWSALLACRPAQHLFYGSILVITLFWHLKAGIIPGLGFHILALTAATLMMGWRLALIAGSLAQLLLVLTGQLDVHLLGFAVVLQVAAPVAFTYLFFLMVYQRLVHNPFVYILVAGFLNAGFTHAFSDILMSLAYWLGGEYELSRIWNDYLRYLPLMMFPEGVVNGMFISGMLVFHTRWLSTFDEDSYFR
jgi:uncharacterized membrane protein